MQYLAFAIFSKRGEGTPKLSKAISADEFSRCSYQPSLFFLLEGDARRWLDERVDFPELYEIRELTVEIGTVLEDSILAREFIQP